MKKILLMMLLLSTMFLAGCRTDYTGLVYDMRDFNDAYKTGSYDAYALNLIDARQTVDRFYSNFDFGTGYYIGDEQFNPPKLDLLKYKFFESGVEADNQVIVTEFNVINSITPNSPKDVGEFFASMGSSMGTGLVAGAVSGGNPAMVGGAVGSDQAKGSYYLHSYIEVLFNGNKYSGYNSFKYSAFTSDYESPEFKKEVLKCINNSLDDLIAKLGKEDKKEIMLPQNLYTLYYYSPSKDRAKDYLSKISNHPMVDVGSVPALAGFYKEVFVKYPELAKDNAWYESLNDIGLLTVATAAWGNGLDLSDYKSQSVTVNNIIQNMSQQPQPNSKSYSIQTFGDIDFMWGGYLASRKTEYLDKIFALAPHFNNRKDQHLFMLGYMSLWSMTSNAMQHYDVYTYLKTKEKEVRGEYKTLITEAIAKAEQGKPFREEYQIKEIVDSAQWSFEEEAQGAEVE